MQDREVKSFFKTEKDTDVTISDAVELCQQCLDDLERSSVKEVKNAIVGVIRNKLHEISMCIEAQNISRASLMQPVYFDAITSDGTICPHVTKHFLDGMKYHLIRGYNQHNQVIKEDTKYASLCEDYNSLVKRMNDKVAASIKNGTIFTDMRGHDMSNVDVPPKTETAYNPSKIFEHFDDHSEDDIEIECPNAPDPDDDERWVTAEEFFGPGTVDDQVREALENAKREQDELAEMRNKLHESFKKQLNEEASSSSIKKSSKKKRGNKKISAASAKKDAKEEKEAK